MITPRFLKSFNEASDTERLQVIGLSALLVLCTAGGALSVVVVVLFIDGCWLLIKGVVFLIQKMWVAYCRRLEAAKEAKQRQEEQAERERQEQREAQREEQRRQQLEAEEAKKPKPPTKEEREAAALQDLNRRIEAAQKIIDPVTQLVAIAEANKDYLAALRKKKSV